MYSRNIDDIETILKEIKPFDGETKAEIFHKAISNFLKNIQHYYNTAAFQKKSAKALTLDTRV